MLPNVAVSVIEYIFSTIVKKSGTRGPSFFVITAVLLGTASMAVVYDFKMMDAIEHNSVVEHTQLDFSLAEQHKCIEELAKLSVRNEIMSTYLKNPGQLRKLIAPPEPLKVPENQ